MNLIDSYYIRFYSFKNFVFICKNDNEDDDDGDDGAKRRTIT